MAPMLANHSTAASRCILVLFEWYGCPKMHPKSSCNLFSTFHIKTIRNIVCEYLKTKIFSWDTNILPQMHWKSNIFGHSVTTTGGFWVSLNYPILNSEKTLCPKIVWMQHCIQIKTCQRASKKRCHTLLGCWYMFYSHSKQCFFRGYQMLEV